MRHLVLKNCILLEPVWQELPSSEELNTLVFLEVPYQDFQREDKAGRTFKITERDRGMLNRTVLTNHRRTAPKVTVKLTQHMFYLVSNKTICCKLNKNGFHERAAFSSKHSV